MFLSSAVRALTPLSTMSFLIFFLSRLFLVPVALIRLFYDFQASKGTAKSAAEERRAKARVHYFMENQSIKNAYDSDGQAVWVATLPEPVVSCVLGLQSLCVVGAYEIAEFEAFLAPIGGSREYLRAAASKAKQTGNERYSEGLKDGKTVETALASYSLAVLLSLSADPEKHVRSFNCSLWPGSVSYAPLPPRPRPRPRVDLLF